MPGCHYPCSSPDAISRTQPCCASPPPMSAPPSGTSAGRRSTLPPPIGHGKQRNDRRSAGTDLENLLLAAAAVALCRLGQPGCTAVAAAARRARSLPQLGLGGGGVARRSSRHRTGPARAWRVSVVGLGSLHDGGLYLRPGAAY